MSDRTTSTSKKNHEDIQKRMAHDASDVNASAIFSNHKLTSQVLRSYSDIPLFADVQPDDIENLTNEYSLLTGIEFQSDSVHKVRIRLNGAEHEVYVISLIEHKSYVEYDIPFQLLRYMTAIWYEYAKKKEAEAKGSSKQKEFRYPLIIPLVYYEGSDKWTAPFHLKERIEFSEYVNGFCPDFRYQIITCRDFDDEALKQRNDEMSLVIMINKIQSAEDFHRFLNNSCDYLSKIYKESGPDIQKIIRDILYSLAMKGNIPSEQARETVKDLEEGGMGYLFENIKTWDAPAAWREVEEMKKIMEKTVSEMKDEANRQVDEANRQVDEKNLFIVQSFRILMEEKIRSGITKEQVIESFRNDYHLEQEIINRL